MIPDPGYDDSEDHDARDPEQADRTLVSKLVSQREPEINEVADNKEYHECVFDVCLVFSPESANRGLDPGNLGHTTPEIFFGDDLTFLLKNN